MTRNTNTKGTHAFLGAALIAMASASVSAQVGNLGPSPAPSTNPESFLPGSGGGGSGPQMDVTIEARDDVPGSVAVKVQALVGSVAVKTETLVWSGNDNDWSSQTAKMPVSAEKIRLTFINDSCLGGCPEDQDADRNAHIDWLVIDGDFVEGEDFDDDGGPDPDYPGAGIDTIDSRTCATLGNQDDWCEYDLLSLATVDHADGTTTLRIRTGHADADVLVVFGTAAAPSSIQSEDDAGIEVPLLAVRMRTDLRGHLELRAPTLGEDVPLFAQLIVLEHDGVGQARVIRFE